MCFTCLGVVLGTDNMSCIIIQFLNRGINGGNPDDIIINKVNFNNGIIENAEKEKNNKNLRM